MSHSFFLLFILTTWTAYWVQGFALSVRGWVQRPVLSVTGRASKISSSKPDLFSDDLFGEGGDVAKKKGVEPIKSKSKYLDQDWQLSPEDQKEYKGFSKSSNNVIQSDSSDDEPEIAFPCFALMYRLRKEYVDQKIDSVLADHNRYCTRFKRLINSEAVSIRNRKGFVLLWAGLTANDKTETRAEIKEFIDEDPLIEKDMIEKWDIIDLENKTDKVIKGKAPSVEAKTS